MDRPPVPDSERAAAHVTSASRLLYLLAILKVFGFLGAARLMAGGAAGTGLPAGVDPRNAAMMLMLWYFAGGVLCIVLARGLTRRQIWARNIGLAYAGFHIAGLIFVMRAGVPAVINGVLGLMLLVTLLLASGLGAFEKESSEPGAAAS